MPTCDGVDDIVALVDAIDASPNILVDFNNSPLFYSDWSAPPPLNDGPIYLAPSHEGRVIGFNVNVEKQATAAEVSAALQPAIRYISRGQVWLMFQKAGGDPVFFKLRRSSVTAIQEFFEVIGSTKTITLALNADPFAEGLAVTGTVTITNNPAAVIDPMQFAFEDIQGDVLAPLYLTFPTADLLHKIKWASEAIFIDDTPVLLLDDFDRPNSVSSVGDPQIGPTPVAQGGVAGIINNQLYFSTGSGSTYSVVWDMGTPNGVIEAPFTDLVAGNSTGFYVRSSSDENGILIGDSAIYTNVAGGYSLIGAHTTNLVDGDWCRVVMNGNSIRVYRQAGGVGEFVLINSQSIATHNTIELHGVCGFGAGGLPGRWGSIKFTALSATPQRTAPYYKSLATATKDASPATGWTITDTADAGAIGANRRVLTKTAGDRFMVPTSAAILPWDDLPPGDYRVFVRAMSADLDTKLMFFNRPPRSGSVLTEDDAVTWTAAGPTPSATGHRDWFDLGVAAMPGGSPIPDIMYDLDPIPDTGLWNVAVATDAASLTMGLDAIMLVPAGRTGTITRHGGATFTDDFEDKTVVIDGINSRRYASGTAVVDPTVTVTTTPALEMYGALPVVVPNCQNILTFLADTAYYDAARVNDSKTLTTLIEWLYHPRYLNDRPDTT